MRNSGLETTLVTMDWRKTCARFICTGLLVLLTGYYGTSAALASHPEVVTLVPISNSGGGGGTCIEPCICKWKNGKESVTCHQAGWIEIPANGFEATAQVLDVSGNPLTTLGPNYFRRLGLTHLQRVILQRCSLRHIDSTAFAGLTNLVELDLSHNSLSTVPGQAFVYVPEMRELKLNGNPLVRINGSPFTAASKLVRLEMANCQIIQLDVKAFTNLEMVERLRLDGNLIEALPTAALAPLRSVRGIDLHHNPWNCTCTLRPLRAWLAARNMPFSVPPLCLAPVRLRGQSWNRMPLDELACPPRVHAVDSLVQVTAGHPATLACAVRSNPEASVSWFFADRLIVNMTSTSGDANSPEHQIYFLREIGDKTDKSSQLVLNAAREQDSGFYVCQAVNRAGKVTANVTLLVKAGPPEVTGSRGFTAGLILAIFAILIAVLLVCCVCSLKRARSHASLRMRRRASSVSGLQPSQPNGTGSNLYDKSDQSDPFLQKHLFDDESRGLLKNQTNGLLSKSAQAEDGASNFSHSHDPANEPIRFQDKQWLVNHEPLTRTSTPPSLKPQKVRHQSSVTSAHSFESGAEGGHRQIALYQNQNKVLFNSPLDQSSPLSMSYSTKHQHPVDRSSISPPPDSHSLLSSPLGQGSNTRNYPDLVDVLPVVAGYEPSDVASVDEEAEIAQIGNQQRTKDFRPSPVVSRYFQQRRQDSGSASFGRRFSITESTGTGSGLGSIGSTSALINGGRRLSDWELNELDANQDWAMYSYNLSQSDWGCDLDIDSAQPGLTQHHHPDEFDEDFQRRYAYHTGQLNRFLLEYRALQKRLARMQNTWGRCLDAADYLVASKPPVRNHQNHHSHHSRGRPNHRHRQYLTAPRPLRPILKNRSASVQPPPQQPPLLSHPSPSVVHLTDWSVNPEFGETEDIVDPDSPPTPVSAENPYSANTSVVEQLYYS